jgi:hypothetical protein
MVRLWNVDDGSVAGQLPFDVPALTAVAFSGPGVPLRRLAAAGSGEIRVWDFPKVDPR